MITVITMIAVAIPMKISKNDNWEFHNRTNQLMSDKVRSSQIQWDQVKSNQIKSSQVKSNQFRSDQVRSGQIKFARTSQKLWNWAMDSSPDPVILPGDPVSLISRLELEPVWTGPAKGQAKGQPGPGQGPARARPRASQGPGQRPAKGQAKGQPRARPRASQGQAKGQPCIMDLVQPWTGIPEEIQTWY